MKSSDALQQKFAAILGHVRKIEIIYLEWNTAAPDPVLGLGKGIEWVLNFIIVLYQQYFISSKRLYY